MKIKVGFIINFKSTKWLGGYNYFKNLFQFISENKLTKIEPIIITDNDEEIKKDEIFKSYRILKTKIVSRSNLFNKIFSKILIIIFGKNFFLDNYLFENNIKILSHSGWIGNKSKILNYPWIPDLQEIYYPENFSLVNKIIRRFRIFCCRKYSTNILISSRAVREDLKKISYKAYSKSFLIKHIVGVPEPKELKSLKYLKKKYNIKKNYFFLPNHYWIHKNHIVVLKALNYNKIRNKFQIVSTGNFSDHRDNNHTKKIKKFIDSNCLNQDYLILKIVPYIDLMSLLYHSIALINPSKSEGWSNTVEQAKSMYKNIIISNIKVHKEQANKNTKLFEPDDYTNLCKILNKEYSDHLKKKKKNRNNYSKNNKKLGKKFIIDYEKKILRYYPRT